MATYIAGGGPLFLPADMGLLELQYESYDYAAWEIANGFFTKDTAATKVQVQMDQHKPDISINAGATEWYTEVSTQVGSNEIVSTRKTYGASGSNVRNVKLTLKGQFNVVSGVVLNGVVNEMNEAYELIGRTNRTFNSTLKDIRLDYGQWMDYYGKANGNLAELTLNGNDTISTENSGNNPLRFKLRGFDGNDVMTGTERADELYGDEGNDQMTGRNGNDYADGGLGDDTLEGNLGADRLIGNLGADKLYGGQGSDALIGGLGDDILNGGLDDDQLTGGIGADKFVLSKGGDTINDFNSKDGDLLQIPKGQTYNLNQLALGLSVERNEGKTLLLGILASNFDAKACIIEI